MEHTLQNRTKKFLSLLKNSAQNEAFVQLVTDNLKLELQQKPWKMLRVLDFIINDLPRSNSDFTRLKVNESGLLQSLLGNYLRAGMTLQQVQDYDVKNTQSILDHMNSIPDDQKRQKFIDKLNGSILILRFDSEIDIENENMAKLSFFTLSDLMRSNKTFFNDLIQNYSPLLSDLNFNQMANDQRTPTGKDNIKDMVMKSIGGFKTDKIKLSDLIDESFFDDIVDDPNSQTQYSASHGGQSKKSQQEQNKFTLSELITHYKQQSYKTVIDLRSIASKRAKSDNTQISQSKAQVQVEANAHRFIIMSPQLALVLHFIQQLINEDWKCRQSAASVIRTIIELCQTISPSLLTSGELFNYHIATYFNDELGYQVTQTHTVKQDTLLTMMMPYLFIFLMKDQFNDFEELKVLTPAREEGLKLLNSVVALFGSQNQENVQIDSQQALFQNEIGILIQQLPVLLKAVEVDTWPSRYNFFLLLKGMINEKNKQQIFQMFNKVLIESLLKVEDEVMILVTELIQSMLDLYLQQSDYELQISQLLKNLQENLKQSDEIESSSISVFSLINKILESVPNIEKLNFNIDLNIICPFNFHKIVNVRYSYNQIINKCLNHINLQPDQLQALAQLTIQSITMERSSQLVHLLYTNLKLLVKSFQRDDQLQQFYVEMIYNMMTYNSILFWLFSYHLQTFETFLFYESKNFESVQQDYYKIVYRPTTHEEIKQFYYAKMNNLTKAIAILMTHSPHVAQHIVQVLEQQLLPPESMDPSYSLTPPVHENHFIYLLILCNFYELYEHQSQNETSTSHHNNMITTASQKDISKQSIDQYLDLEYLNNVVNSLLSITEESIGVFQFGELDKIDSNMQILFGLLQKNSSQKSDQQQQQQQQQAIMMLSNLSQLLQQCYIQHRLVNLNQIQQQIEILTQIFGQIQVPEIYECFSELMQLFTSLIRYANSTCIRVKAMSAILHLHLVTCSSSAKIGKDDMLSMEVERYKSTSVINQSAPLKSKTDLQMQQNKSQVVNKTTTTTTIPAIPDQNTQMQIDTTTTTSQNPSSTSAQKQSTKSVILLKNQLNNLIKPILGQVKSESIEFIQEINSVQLVRLIDILFAKNKSKAAQQILQVIVKSLEQKGEDDIQDRGSKFVLKEMIKNHVNIFQAYGCYLGNYLQVNLTVENYQSWVKAILFIVALLKDQKVQQVTYSEQALVLLKQLTLVFTLQSLSNPNKDQNQMLQNSTKPNVSDKQPSSIPSFQTNPQDFSHILSALVKTCFELFTEHQIQLISIIVSNMEHQQQHSNGVKNTDNNSSCRSAFQSLIDLLDSKNSDLMRFIPVFIIPVIQNIQYSRRIFNDDKQITLILASLLSLLPLNLVQISDLTNQMKQQTQEQLVSSDQDNQLSQLQKPSQDDQFFQQLQSQASEGYKFLQIFVNNQMVTEYEFVIKVKAQLRDYQKQGINWMATLGHYNLNCALCDDMGLGKTLQSLCVVMNESHKKFKKTGQKQLNMIVSPTTITHNWYAEVYKFFDGVKAVVFEGTQSQKNQILSQLKTFDIVIISYEKLRNDIKQFENLDFFYLIVDEAHIVKNSKAKITQAVKSIKADKKIALTGTPLQNRVSELWSIFDFLMPGFLEEEQIFNKKYNQYLTSNIKRLSEKLEETQSFVEALKSLKKRIQPFILRRTKDQVLKELPPKIIQDVICEMTPFQEYTHSLVEKLHPIQQQLQQVDQQQPQQSAKGGKQQQQQPKLGKQILQNLILHRKVCNHPMLVANQLKDDKNIQKHLNKKKESELMGYENSGKLIGLYDKLVECEIIESKKPELSREESKSHSHARDTQDSDTGVSNMFDLAATSLSLEEQRLNELNSKHRVLIFCQMTSFLNMIVEQVLKKFHVPFLELLSSHTPKQRVEMCNQFNTDPSIRVLILTTQVGGLGLNLTGADTVIFAEHDWNPMRDLQAIDRAHRIGQTRQVCVYRLIVKDTIEEKIMGLQRFKENLAKSLVQAKGAMKEGEDASNLEMSELLNSFQEHSAFNDNNSGGVQGASSSGVKKGQGQVALVEDKLISNLDEIWQGGNFEDM